MNKVEMLEAFSKMSEAELEDTVKYIQQELAEKNARKRATAWSNVRKALTEYLNLGGCISFLWDDEEGMSRENTLGKGEVETTDCGEILLHNLTCW